jgi:hypothetical protein
MLVQSLWLLIANLLTQEPSKQIFKSLRLGIPKPPKSLLRQTNCQLAKCIFLCPLKSFQRQFAICVLIKSKAYLGNLKKQSK